MSERINFGKLYEAIQPPNLIELQIKSYEEFFQTGVEPSKRKNVGFRPSSVNSSRSMASRRNPRLIL